MLKLVREILYKVYHWHRVSASVKAKALSKGKRSDPLLQRYVFKRCSEIPNEGYRVSTEAIREWFHSVGKMGESFIQLCSMGVSE